MEDGPPRSQSLGLLDRLGGDADGVDSPPKTFAIRAINSTVITKNV